MKEKFKIVDKGTTLDTFKNYDCSLSLYAAKVRLGLVPKMCYDSVVDSIVPCKI